jgi:hypothetical protein
MELKIGTAPLYEDEWMTDVRSFALIVAVEAQRRRWADETSSRSGMSLPQFLSLSLSLSRIWTPNRPSKSRDGHGTNILSVSVLR